MPKDSKPDIYARVTADMIAALEKGVLPWRKHWDATSTFNLPLRSNSIPYTGINILLLWVSGEAAGYQSPRWITFKQAHELGAHVQKGEKGTTIVYADKFTKSIENQGKEAEQKLVWFMKTYTVFNSEQVKGLPENYYQKPAALQDESQRVQRAEAFFDAIPATIFHGGNKAFYNPATDAIALPSFAAFHTPEAYYSVRGHETIHWTGHVHRLDRRQSVKSASRDYAFEELIAELGASFLCAEMGIYNATRDDHASYLAAWLKNIQEDNRVIFRAASEAQRATEYLKNFHHKETINGT